LDWNLSRADLVVVGVVAERALAAVAGVAVALAAAVVVVVLGVAVVVVVGADLNKIVRCRPFLIKCL
jgi:hypothetical protein